MDARLALICALCALACDGNQADVSSEAKPPEPVAETAAPTPSWAGVRHEDGWLELRAGSSTGWLVLRRLEGSSWLRGYSYGYGREQVSLGRRTRYPLAQVWSSGPRSRFRRFWLHAQVLADLTEGEHGPSVAGHGVSYEDLEEFLEGTSEVDGSLFHAVDAPWGEYAVEVKTPRPGGPADYCEARVAFPAGAEHALIGIRGVRGGTGGFGSLVHCPDAAGWIEVGRRRVDLPEEGEDFYVIGAHRAEVYPSCPSRVSARDLVRYARNPRLRLCDSTCCYDATDAFREELTSARSRHQTLTDLIAERPDPRIFGPGPQGPGSP